MEWIKLFDELKSSALKEMANIGISHVATAIGEIANEKIDISLPEMGNFSKTELLNGPDGNSHWAAAYFTVDGIADLTEILIILPKEDAFGLMEKFVNVTDPQQIDVKALSIEEQASIFSEISTVIAATYFSAVNSMFNLNTYCAIPQTSFGTLQTADFIQEKLQQREGINIQVSFSSIKSNIRGNFMLLPDPNTLGKFFRSIGLDA